MPRSARLDAPGLLQHVIVRGVERSDIFCDDSDRSRFVATLFKLLVQNGADAESRGDRNSSRQSMRALRNSSRLIA